MERLRTLGTVVWLRSGLGVALERARRAGARPMLDGRSLEDLEALYREREPYYRQAHLTIDTGGIGLDQVVRRTLSTLRRMHAVRA